MKHKAIKIIQPPLTVLEADYQRSLMETATPRRSIKLSVKLKRDENITKCAAVHDHHNNTEQERDISPSSPSACSKNHSPQNKQNTCGESSQYQLVLYDPSVNEAKSMPEPFNQQSPFLRPHPFSDPAQRVLPSIGAFTVQCAECFKWRIIPTKEKYEEIREHIIQRPFTCAMAQEWKPDMSCEDPPDITQDGSRLWAIDKPSIAQPPPGWQRLLRIRGEGSTKFADVYYVSPSGKSLRSMVDIQKYLYKHPEYMQEGVKLSQFSFQIPKPLQENYVRKRPTARPPTSNNASEHAALPGRLPPSEVKAITWVSPNVGTEVLSKKKGKKRNWNPDSVIDLSDDELSTEQPHRRL